MKTPSIVRYGIISSVLISNVLAATSFTLDNTSGDLSDGLSNGDSITVDGITLTFSNVVTADGSGVGDVESFGILISQTSDTSFSDVYSFDVTFSHKVKIISYGVGNAEDVPSGRTFKLSGVNGMSANNPIPESGSATNMAFDQGAIFSFKAGSAYSFSHNIAPDPIDPLFNLKTLTVELSDTQLGDFVGSWSTSGLNTPSSLRETYYNSATMSTRTSEDSSDFAQAGEQLVDVYYPDPASTEVSVFSVSASGVATGGVTGEILSVSRNCLTFADSSEIIKLYANVTSDVLLDSFADPDHQGFSLTLKDPLSMVTADLAGDWSLIQYSVPTDIVKNTSGGMLLDTYFLDDPETSSGTVTFSSNGAVTGDATGTIVASSNSVATVTTGGENIAFRVNESKSVMISTTSGDSQEYIVLLRKPTSVATSDLAGYWRASVLSVPDALTETYYNTSTMATRQGDSDDFAQSGEILVDVFHSEKFTNDRFLLKVQPTGSFTGIGSTTGTLSGSGQTVSMSIDGEVLTFFPNADKTVMAAVRLVDSRYEMVTMVKTSTSLPSSFNEEIGLDIVDSSSGTGLTWNGSGNWVLEESTNLGDWSEVDESRNQEFLQLDTLSADKFYRVMFSVD